MFQPSADGVGVRAELGHELLRRRSRSLT